MRTTRNAYYTKCVLQDVLNACRKSCRMVGRQAGAETWLEFLFSMAFILATNRKTETHCDYNAEDDNIEQ